MAFLALWLLLINPVLKLQILLNIYGNHKIRKLPSTKRQTRLFMPLSLPKVARVFSRFTDLYNQP